jgi:hypothetical protein
MTDKEHQELIKWLRDMQWRYGASTEYGKIADEIEWLRNELTKAHWLCGEMIQTQYTLEREVARLKDEYGVLLERTTNMLDMTVRG